MKMQRVTPLLFVLLISVECGYAQITARADRSTSELISDLRSSEPMIRAAAACELGDREAASAIAPLIALLGDDTSIAPFTCGGRWGRTDVNSPGREAAHALIEIGDEAAKPVAAVLHHQSGPVREKAVWILGSLEYRPAIGDMTEMLIDDAYHLARSNAAWALGAMDVESATPSLRKALLADKHPDVREQSAWALGAIGARRAADALTAALKDQSSDVRKQAIWALSAIH